MRKKFRAIWLTMYQLVNSVKDGLFSSTKFRSMSQNTGSFCALIFLVPAATIGSIVKIRTGKSTILNFFN